MKPHALWGSAFAFLATAIVVGIINVIVHAGGLAASAPPQTPLEFRDAYLPALKPLAELFALDQMFTVAYGAAFVGAALAWPRPMLVSLLAIIAGVATAGIDTLENIRTSVALAQLHERPPSDPEFQLLQLLGALKWVGGGVTSLAIAALIPRRGVLLVLVAVLLGLGGLAELLLGVVRLGVLDALISLEPALAKGVIVAMPAGLLLLGVALLSEARTAP